MTVTVLWVTLHLLGVGMVIGVVFATLILLYRQPSDVTAIKLFQSIRNLGSYGAGLAILSGIVMAYRYGIPLKGNWWFDTKLALIAADGLIAQQVINRQIKMTLANTQSSDLRTKLLAWAWLSVIIIIAIVAISVYRGKVHR